MIKIAAVFMGILSAQTAYTAEHALPPSATPETFTVSAPSAAGLEVKSPLATLTNLLGARLYTGAEDTGTRNGNLWTTSSTRLATTTFQNGQEVRFASPVATTANTAYGASYVAPAGSYHASGYLLAADGTAGILAPPSPIAAGGNGVYSHTSASAFPTQTYNATNSWVDVMVEDHSAPAGILFWTDNWRQQVFKDTARPQGAPASINITAAKNEYEPFQVLLRSSSAFIITGVSFSALTDSAGTISSDNITANFVEYEYFAKNSGAPPDGGCAGPLNDPVRVAPAEFPEKLSNETQVAVAANTTQPVWVRLYVPPNTPAGTYSGNSTVTTDRGTVTVPIYVDVKAVQIPEPAHGQFHLEFVVHPWNVTLSYGYAVGSPQWWATWDKIATILRQNRVNVLSVDTQYMRDRDSNGWAIFDKYVQTFIDKGGIRRLAGMPLGSINLQQKIIELDTHLKAKGWDQMWQQRIMDEPFSDAQKAAYQTMAGIVKQAAPDMKRGDALDTVSGLENAMEVWVPATWSYEVHRAAYDAKRRIPGNEIWIYTCCAPAGSWLNRFIDARVFFGELLGWYAFKEDMQGFMHWGLMAWNGPGAGWYTKYLGDAYSIYPDSGGRVKSSIRMEAMREAAEAYELLKILKAKNEHLAKSIANAVVWNGNGWQEIGYLNDIDQIQSYRNQVVQAASE